MTPNSTSISASVRIADGSSRMSIPASPASALAIDTCCCSAIDRSPTAPVAYRAGRPSSAEQFDDLGVLRGPVDPAPLADLPAGEDVLRHGQLGEQLRFLVDGGDAERDRVGRGGDGHRPALEGDAAGVGGLRAGDDLDQRGLAGAVLADQGVAPAPTSTVRSAFRIARTAPNRLAIPGQPAGPPASAPGPRDRCGWPPARPVRLRGQAWALIVSPLGPSGPGDGGSPRGRPPAHRSVVEVADVLLGDRSAAAQQQHLGRRRPR